MKNIILSLLVITIYSCKAQSPIKPVYETGSQNINGAYYKDINNFNDQFVGTWVFDDGINYLKVTFKKKPQFLETTSTRSYYVDYLIGEYEYKLNGSTIVNTLTNINVNHTSIFKYNMYSMLALESYNYPACTDCGTSKRLVMKFQELPTRDMRWAADANFIMRHFVEASGVEKLKVNFIMNGPAGNIPTGLPDDYQGFSLPFGDYTLVKQP